MCNLETHANLHQEHGEDQGDEEEEGVAGGRRQEERYRRREEEEDWGTGGGERSRKTRMGREWDGAGEGERDIVSRKSNTHKPNHDSKTWTNTKRTKNFQKPAEATPDLCKIFKNFQKSRGILP